LRNDGEPEMKGEMCHWSSVPTICQELRCEDCQIFLDYGMKFKEAPDGKE